MCKENLLFAEKEKLMNNVKLKHRNFLLELRISLCSLNFSTEEKKKKAANMAENDEEIRIMIFFLPFR